MCWGASVGECSETEVPYHAAHHHHQQIGQLQKWLLSWFTNELVCACMKETARVTPFCTMPTICPMVPHSMSPSMVLVNVTFCKSRNKLAYKKEVLHIRWVCPTYGTQSIFPPTLHAHTRLHETLALVWMIQMMTRIVTEDYYRTSNLYDQNCFLIWPAENSALTKLKWNESHSISKD